MYELYPNLDKDKCKRGISALKNYQRKWDEKNKIFQARPLHDWSSHGSDAMRYLAVGLDENRPTKNELLNLKRTADMDYNIFGG